MNHRLFLSIFFLTLIVSACRKKDGKPFDDSQPVTATDYFPMKAGNYWIYERFETDTNGIVYSLNIFDSVYVEKDTIVNGKNCWKVTDPGSYFGVGYDLYETENDLLKYHDGTTIFSANNFSTPLYTYAEMTFSGKDTAYTATLQMTDMGATVKVKGGSFVSVTARTTFKAYPNNYCDRVRLFPVRKTICSYRVGIIYSHLPGFCTDDKIAHRELVRYHLN